MAEEMLEQEASLEEGKKKFGLISILIYVAILLVAIIVMVIISNMVFNVRNAKVHEVEQEVWAPATETKSAPLKTMAVDSFQINLNDPIGNSPSFVKVTMALAYQDVENTSDGGEGKAVVSPLTQELTDRTSEIRDKVIGLISSKSYEDLDSTDKQSMLKKEIVNQVNSVLIHGVIQDVYITDFNLVKTKY